MNLVRTSPVPTLNVIRPLTLNVVRLTSPPITDHSCYILKSAVSNRTYIGYTINLPHRIRQHNGEIVGGAKRTRKWRPWTPVCHVTGFYDASSALRFEYRLQHPGRRKKAKENAVTFTLQQLVNLITSGDGSIAKGNKMAWPILTITWFQPHYSIQHPHVINQYK